MLASSFKTDLDTHSALKVNAEHLVHYLSTELQTAGNDPSILKLQDLYCRLREAFAYVLFELKKVSTDHYAWLLMDHDAGRALERLITAENTWQHQPANVKFHQAYQRALADFRWIIATAVSCQP